MAHAVTRDELEEENRLLEKAIALKASSVLRQELGLIATILTAAHLRGTVGIALKRLVHQLFEPLNPTIQTDLEVGRDLGLRLGYEQEGYSKDHLLPFTPFRDQDLARLIWSADARIKERLREAITLADAMPMQTNDDLVAVLAKARSAVQLAETDAGWTVHRSIANGHAQVAKAAKMTVVWVAERNACPACLAYQGRVVAPGQAFPEGLTYGDRPVMPYGKLTAPPLHPHCRCQLETSTLVAGTIDRDLAREAARSVARGLSDVQSEVGKLRSADKLIKGATGLPAVQLPKSVVDRARRNVIAKQFKARPGSAQARAEIAQRARDRARARR
jgi:DNA-binding phage protein